MDDSSSNFYLSPGEEWEPDSPNQLARDLVAIAFLEQNPTPLSVDLLSLPNEIISQIFYHACLPIPGDKEWRRSFYPLWLGKLCRAWRNIAWETSEIWATVVVRAFHKDMTKCTYAVQADLLREWLARAKGRKLDIYFGEAKGNRGLTPPFSLMKLIIGHSEKWQDVRFHLSKPWWSLFTRAITIRLRSPEDKPETSALPDPSALFLPNLRSIVIHRSGADGPQIEMLNLGSAPALRSVGISGIPNLISSDIAKSFPCNQITELTLTAHDICELRDLLHHFPRLRSIYFVDSRHLQVRYHATHDKIRNLTIHSSDYEWNGFGTLADLVTLPALQSLDIAQPGYIDYTRHILPFVLRSKCRLTSLTLECLLLVEYELVDFLESLDSLTEIHIRNSEKPVQRYARVEANRIGLGLTFFETLHPDQDTPFLPNLEVFSYEGPLAVQAIDFIEPFIVRSRMRGAQIRDLDKVALLKQAAITADQYSDVADFSIAEYSDPQYIWEIMRMVEEGVLVLRNMNGSPWS